MGKNPKTAPSLAANAAWPIGMRYMATAIASATASDTSDAIQARARNTPSIRKSVASGKTAASELHASEWATGSRIWRYMSGTFLHEEDDKIVRRRVFPRRVGVRCR